VPLLEKAIDEVIRLAGNAYNPYIDSLTTNYGIELLCKRYELPRPAKATVGQPSPQKILDVINCLEKLNKELTLAQRESYRIYSDKLQSIKK